METGEFITDSHGRRWKVMELQPIDAGVIQDLLRRESAAPGQEVHVPVLRAALRLEGEKS